MDLLAEMAYDRYKVPENIRLRAIELYMQFTISKHSEKDVMVTTNAPTIGLPPMEEKPKEAYPAVAERMN